MKPVLVCLITRFAALPAGDILFGINEVGIKTRLIVNYHPIKRDSFRGQGLEDSRVQVKTIQSIFYPLTPWTLEPFLGKNRTEVFA